MTVVGEQEKLNEAYNRGIADAIADMRLVASFERNADARLALIAMANRLQEMLADNVDRPGRSR